jgi:hypothetical protein
MIRRKNYLYIIILSFLVVLFILINNFVLVKFDFLFNSATYLTEDNNLHETDSFKNRVNYLNDNDDHLIWFVQISDLHLSLFHEKTIKDDLNYFCSDILKIIEPKVIMASGDLTDAKNDDLMGSRQYENEWKIYQQIIHDNDVLKYSVWLDVRGNHDNFDVPHRKNDLNFFRYFFFLIKSLTKNSYEILFYCN